MRGLTKPAIRRSLFDTWVDMPHRLEKKLENIAADLEVQAFAVTWRDCVTKAHYALNGDSTFHAASTIKVPVLVALFRAVEAGKVSLEDRLHVRNRFFSVINRSPYQMDASRDGDPEVHKRIGRTMPIGELARWMIIASSNLATNLLLDLIGLEFAQQQLEKYPGILLRRGVEDHAAFDAGINNEVTSDSLADLMMDIEKAEVVTRQSRQSIIDILLAQKFNDMIPKGLPSSARVAHKTGEISSACHDAAIVYPEHQNPYVLIVLTSSSAAPNTRRNAVAKMAGAVHQRFREE